jgi:hypothetical protein
LIVDKIEELSAKQCFYEPMKPKKCSCFSTPQGDGEAKNAVASYILFWAKTEPLQQMMIMIEKTKGILIAEHLQGDKFYAAIGKEQSHSRFHSLQQRTQKQI